MAEKMTDKQPDAKQEVDWVGIEVEYRAGIKTVEQIGKEYGVSKGRISQVAKRDGWARDLSKKIELKTQEKLNKLELNKTLNKDKKRLVEADYIESVSDAQVRIITRHQSTIAKYQELCDSLLDEIELMTGERLSFDQLGEIMADQETDRMNALYRKAVSMPTRVDSVKKLVDTLKTLVGLERQAFGIADNANGDANQGKNPIEDLFTALSGRVMGVTASPDNDDD
jgi:hypothetical protein